MRAGAGFAPGYDESRTSHKRIYQVEEGVSGRTTLGWLSVAGRRHFISKHFMFRIGAMLMFSSNQVTPNLDTGFGYCF